MHARTALVLAALLAWATPPAAAHDPSATAIEPTAAAAAEVPGSLVETRAAEAIGLGETVLRSLFADHLQGPASRRFGLEAWQWIVLGLLALLALIASRLASFMASRFLRRHLASRPVLTDELVEGAERPFGLFVGALLFFLVIGGLGLPSAVEGAAILAVRMVLALSGIWALWRMVDIGAAWTTHRAQETASKLDDLLVPVVRRAFKVALVIVGLLFVVEATGVRPTSLLAGLGLGGLAFALAAKDTVGNLFGFATLVVDRPFQIGDWVVVKGAEGTVEEVGMRSTRIRTFYNSVISVPNGQLVDAAIDNMGIRTYRRYSTKLDVDYATPPARLQAMVAGIRELIRLHPYTRKDYFHVYVNELGASGIKVMLYVFHEVPDWATELRERQRLLVDILKLAARLEVGLAFPTQTLHIPGLEAGVRRLAETRDGATAASAPATAAYAVAVPDDAAGAAEVGRAVAAAVVREELAEGELPPPVSG